MSRKCTSFVHSVPFVVYCLSFLRSFQLRNSVVPLGRCPHRRNRCYLSILCFYLNQVVNFCRSNGLLLSQSLFCCWLLQQSFARFDLPQLQRWNRLCRPSFSKDVVLSTVVISGIIFCLFNKGVDDIYHSMGPWLLSQSLFRVCCTVDFAEF